MTDRYHFILNKEQIDIIVRGIELTDMTPDGDEASLLQGMFYDAQPDVINDFVSEGPTIAGWAEALATDPDPKMCPICIDEEWGHCGCVHR